MYINTFNRHNTNIISKISITVYHFNQSYSWIDAHRINNFQVQYHIATLF
jgi:hypothetical protein